MIIENLNILCIMPLYSEKTKFYRAIVNTSRRKKQNQKNPNIPNCFIQDVQDAL